MTEIPNQIPTKGKTEVLKSEITVIKYGYKYRLVPRFDRPEHYFPAFDGLPGFVLKSIEKKEK